MPPLPADSDSDDEVVMESKSDKQKTALLEVQKKLGQKNAEELEKKAAIQVEAKVGEHAAWLQRVQDKLDADAEVDRARRRRLTRRRALER